LRYSQWPSLRVLHFKEQLIERPYLSFEAYFGNLHKGDDLDADDND